MNIAYISQQKGFVTYQPSSHSFLFPAAYLAQGPSVSRAVLLHPCDSLQDPVAQRRNVKADQRVQSTEGYEYAPHILPKGFSSRPSDCLPGSTSQAIGGSLWAARQRRHVG